MTKLEPEQIQDLGQRLPSGPEDWPVDVSLEEVENWPEPYRSKALRLADITWAAGFFEGEGSIVAYSRHGSGRAAVLRMHVAQVDPRPLERLARILGCGKVRGPYKKSNPRARPQWNWQAENRRAQDAFALMVPWLIQKAEKGTLAIEQRAASLVESKERHREAMREVMRGNTRGRGWAPPKPLSSDRSLW